MRADRRGGPGRGAQAISSVMSRVQAHSPKSGPDTTSLASLRYSNRTSAVADELSAAVPGAGPGQPG